MSPRPLDVLLLTRSLNRGGAERQLLTLASGLGERGWRVKIAVFYSGNTMEQEALSRGVDVASLDKQGRWDVWGFWRRFIALLKAERPRVIHSYLTVPNILATASRLSVRGLPVVWGVRVSEMEFQRYDWMAAASDRLEALLSKTADQVVVNSFAGAQAVERKGFPSARVRVIPNGIDTEVFHPDPAQRARQREQWGVLPDERLIGIVGRLDPMKDHSTFLRAAAELKTREERIRFVCVGSGAPAYTEGLRAEAERLGLDDELLWVPETPHPWGVYNALDILTSSSAFGEGFPNVVGEAMACGVPCVVTDVGDSARIVGETGRVVAKGDPRGLCAAWSKLLNGSAAPDPRERIRRLYSVPRLIDATEELLRSLEARIGVRDTAG